MKYALLAVVVVLAGWFLWDRLPGVRTQVRHTVNEWGGWTEEARRDDPVGFIAYAREKLQEDLAAYEDARGALAESERTATERIEEFRRTSTDAGELAEHFKNAFQAAGTDGWPVAVAGREYDEAQLRAQVEELLVERKRAIARITDYQEVLERVVAKRAELRERVSETRALLDDLAAKEELMKIDQLTAEADELLAQVNDLVESHSRDRRDDGDPVRSVDQLLEDAAAAAGEGEEPDDAALAVDAFLKG